MSDIGELPKPVSKPAAVVAPSRVRSIIFISHATPQDNVFAEWLATQLAIAGYEVWCDVTALLGGEAWWDDIDEAIDAGAFRVLFVSTLEGNRKPGTLRELRLALDTREKYQLGDFVIPLKIDDFPFQSMQPSIQDLNCVRFDETWAHGLSRLLKLLEREGAPKSAAAGPACVADWYRRSIDYKRRIVVSRERCQSNWFSFKLPDRLYFHKFRGPSDALTGTAGALGYPYKILGQILVTFASRAVVEDRLGPHFSETLDCPSTSFANDGFETLSVAAFDAANILSDLIRQAWERTMETRGFAFHTMANGQKAWFFKAGVLDKNRGYYESTPGKRSFRQVVGTKSRRTIDGTRVPDGYWHYAVSAWPQLSPFPRLVLKHHVIFTDDGITPWSAADRMHKARRSVCKNWWNAEWRDRLRAFMTTLCESQASLSLDVGGDCCIDVEAASMQITSPWTYYDDEREGLDENAEIELVEDDEEGDADEEKA
ncbi:hypothetical protein ASD50_03710 [Mesorhizobium sp. Root552]|uniref:toll/interleukin-1 receptor domain-containing protein n=1 Tax=Mesorhizobium sp. Root552 TaxID=1736555 RepID=UPI0006FA9AB4|nr:toll/interleukin-1 receptor domain-containing protein [Mesorhizobium sp. Root552]KQZ26524.1 hypothetical protein ASD50_03710 [Mesorhizobium sp. Root552]